MAQQLATQGKGDDVARNLKGRLDRLSLALMGPPGKAEAEAEFEAAIAEHFDASWSDGQKRAGFERMEAARAALHGQAASDRYCADLVKIYGSDPAQRIGAAS
jgi:hypothetical protein